jgi:hypothetical protein
MTNHADEIAHELSASGYISPATVVPVRELIAQAIADATADQGRQLKAIQAAWSRVAGFAVCESCGPEKRYRITIDYRSLEQAQDAYRAMSEITAALEAALNT